MLCHSSNYAFLQGVKKPFEELINVTWGDPHKAGVKPLTFIRQVTCSWYINIFKGLVWTLFDDMNTGAGSLSVPSALEQ